MRGWCREASGVIAAVVGTALGDDRAAQGNGFEPGKPLGDEMRALEDRVREAEAAAAELRARLAQAEVDLKGGGTEEDASGSAAKVNASWVTTEELRAKLRDVFGKMDLNKDGMVDEEERAEASGLLNSLHTEFGLRAEVVFEKTMTFHEFEAKLMREWEVMSKEQALAGVNVARAVAEQLPGGSPDAPLEHLAGMSGEDLLHFCRSSVAPGLEKLLRLQQETLREGRARDDGDGGAEQGNAKFAQGGKLLGQARFGKLTDFTTGLLAKIGLPDHRLME
ncbi:hypothetical protein T484DRAFT_1772370, partial [Baffinella frigidus]